MAAVEPPKSEDPNRDVDPDAVVVAGWLVAVVAAGAEVLVPKRDRVGFAAVPPLPPSVVPVDRRLGDFPAVVDAAPKRPPPVVAGVVELDGADEAAC